MKKASEPRPSVRDQILSAALGLFARQGYSRTTTSALAREAGVAEGTLFRHFKSKDEVLLALLLDVRNRLMLGLERFLAPHSAEVGYCRVMSTIRGYYLIATQHQQEFTILFRDASAHFAGGSEEAQIIRGTYQYLIAYLHKAIEEGKADGSVDPAVNGADTAAVIIGMIIGVARGIHFNFVSPSPTLPDSLASFCAKALRPG